MADVTSQFWIRWGNWLSRQRWTLLIFTAVVTAFLWAPAQRLELDESIESLYDERDPVLLAYQRSKNAFGGDEFVMVGYETDDPTDEDQLREIQTFSRKLSAIPGVRPESTQDLASTLWNPRASGMIRVAHRLPATERALLGLAQNVLIGEDGKTTAIILRLEDEARATVPRRETFRQIRELASQHEPRAWVAGEPIQVHDMFRYVDQDSWVLGIASSALLMSVILVFFRNLRWVILPIVLIQITLLWTRGILALTGMKLSMVSSMLTSLVTIIAIATMMHITVLYREFRNQYSRFEAFSLTVDRLAVPTFWISLTTAIGFAALLISETTPVRSFAVMMSLGSMLIPLVCLLVLPGGILIGNIQADPRDPPGEKQLIQSLQNLAAWSANHPRSILGLTIVASAIAISGLLKLTVETDFSKNFRAASPIVQALRFFETRLGGVGSWEVGFDMPGELTQERLDTLAQLADELRQIETANGTKLTKVIALTDGLNLINRIPASQEERRGRLFRNLPRFRSPTLEERWELLDSLQPEMASSLYNPEQGRMRIVLRSLEQQPSEVKLELIQKVESTARKYYPDAETTGLYVLLTNLIKSLLGDQVTSFLISCAGVALSVAIAFRSLRIGLVAMLPNVLPILAVIGVMGWIGLPINIGTAMIASVSIGLTIDTTILYLAEYQRALKSGANHLEAVRAANGGAGLALTLANIALIVGFSALSLSNFLPLVYFGVLVSTAMLGGLLGNLILLPILLNDKPATAKTPAPPVT